MSSPPPNTLQHVGLILDGNRRWAKAKGLSSRAGHQRGGERFKEVSIAAFDMGVRYLSAFIFSSENWSRTQEEVSFLMRLLVNAVENHLEEFHKRDIKILVIGKRENLKKVVLKAIERTEEKTKNNKSGTLILCFNYGGRQEIIDGVKSVVESGISSEKITEQTFAATLYAAEVPDVDLLIRTSGERRISGFMLWRIAYAELYFTDTLWPDFSPDSLAEAIKDYKMRERRFGK